MYCGQVGRERRTPKEEARQGRGTLSRSMGSCLLTLSQSLWLFRLMIFLLGKPLNSEILLAFSKSWLTVDAFGWGLAACKKSSSSQRLGNCRDPARWAVEGPAGPVQVQDSDPATGFEVRLSLALGEYRQSTSGILMRPYTWAFEVLPAGLLAFVYT